MNGVDISAWQAGINPAAIDADFVIIKATEGTSYVNPFWREWAEATLASGKLLGFYHYANGGDPSAEARFFCDTVREYQGRAVMVLDWEVEGNGQFEMHSRWCDPWLEFVAAELGCTPLLYVMASRLSEYDWPYLWVAQYDNYDPSYYQEHPWNEGAYLCLIRQYKGSGGRVAGYQGNIDLNKAYIDADTWMRLAGNTDGAYRKTSEEEDEMVCLIQPNDEGGLVYYDGTNLHALDHEDEAEAIRMVYRQCHNGKEIPQFKLGSAEAPWASRFVDAVNHGMPEGLVSSFH